MKLEVYSLRFGDPWWLKFCGRSLDQWCERHGHDLRLSNGIGFGYPSRKFCVIDMLRDFVERNQSEWFAYIDGDVWIAPDAPAIPENILPGIHLRADLPGPWTRGFRKWCGRRFSDASVVREWQYRNAGVWFCDRATAELLLPIMQPPFFRGMMEQNQFNYWLAKAAVQEGASVHHLDIRWSMFHREQGPAFAWHLAGKNKGKKLRKLRDQGFVPQSPKS